MTSKTWTYPFPGKFEGLTLAQFLVALPVSVDTVEDDFLHDPHSGEAAARVRLDSETVAEFVGYLLDEDADLLKTITADQLAEAVRTLHGYAEAVIYRDSCGFYDVRFFDSEKAADGHWHELWAAIEGVESQKY